MELKREYRLSAIFALVVVAGLLISQSIISSSAISSSTVHTYNQWTGINDCNFLFFTDGTTFYSKNCDTGVVESGSSAHAILNEAITDATVSGTTSGTVAVRAGNYNFTGTILLDDYVRLVGDFFKAEGETNFYKDETFSGTALISMSNLGSSSLQYPKVQGIAIDCIDQSIDGISLSSFGAVIEQVEVTNCDEGMKFQTGGAGHDLNTVRYSHIHHNVWGIVFSNPSGTIEANEFGFNEKDCINTTGFSQRIMFNKMWSCSDGNSGFSGIQVNGGDYSIIIGNMVEPDGELMNGLSLTTTDSVVLSGNRVKSGSTGNNCIVLTTSTNNTVSNNVCSYSGTRAILESTSADRNWIIDNNFLGGSWSTATVTLTGSNTVVRNNAGFVTEAEGTGTINSGDLNANVTHSLDSTPSAAECTIMFTEDPSTDPTFWWISDITSTQFRLNVNADPGASNLDFSWACRRI